MNGAVREAQVGGAAPNKGHDVVLNPVWETRRSHEDGQGQELAPDDDPLHGDLTSRQVGLDQDVGRRIFTSSNDIAPLGNCPNAVPSTDEFLGCVGPDHTAAG